MKKLILCLCALLLAVLTAVSAGAELKTANDIQTGCPVYIYYVPAVSENKDIRLSTARMIASLILEKRKDYNVFGGAYNSNKDLSKKGDILKAIVKGNNDGKGTIPEKNVPKNLAEIPAEFWFIVPEDAESNIIANAGLMNQCRRMLANGQSRAHFVFIGNRQRAIAPDSELGKLISEGQADYVFTAADFTQNTLPGTEEDREIETGDYLTASFFGTPVDLPLTAKEDGTSSFILPEDGRAVVIVNWKDKVGTTVIRDTTGTATEKQEDLEFSEKGYAYYTATVSKKLEAGEYMVECQDAVPESIMVYWYPDMSGISPVLANTDDLKHGDNEIILKVQNDYGTPERFLVLFSYQKDEEEPVTTTAEYNPEQGGWTANINVDTTVQHVHVTPTVRFRTANGNQIWEWQGEKTGYNVESDEITVQVDAPAEITLYTDEANQKAGSLAYKWSDIFRYNPEDNPVFAYSLPGYGGEENLGIRCEDTENGFRITALNGENLPNAVELKVTATVNDKITDYKIMVNRKDASGLYEAIDVQSGQEGKEIASGGEVKVTATISAEILSEWNAARRQIWTLPSPDQLQMVCSRDESSYPVSAPFEPQEDGSCKAEATIEIPDSQSSDENAAVSIKFKQNIQISSEENERIGKAEETVITAGLDRSISFRIRNESPAFDDEYPAKDEVCIEGFPWAYEKNDDLLSSVFGTNLPFELFKDKENHLTSVTVTVENIQGLELPDYGENDDKTWSYTITTADDSVVIGVLSPGKVTIRLSAEDGVNRSEEYTATVWFYSRILRYASYAAAGLAGLLVLLAIVLIIRQARKPSFSQISIRCYSSSDEDEKNGREFMSKCSPVSMAHFRKKGITLTNALIICRQPPLSKEYTAVTEDILLLPTKHNEIVLNFGKHAMKTIGRHEKKQTISQNPDQNTYRMRVGNEYIIIENVQL